MGKAEKGTPKDLANRMKAKGLQKLRWYCQMCQKQCRDENGFKCHTTSESHQRQLLLFAENPNKYLDSFSEEFFEGYISLLKRRFGTKRVHANNVYQEYIHDRDHVHMNATEWETLTDFVKWLGRQGHCIVDETEKGWFVAYIDRDPETLLREKQKAKREKHEKDEEERFQEFFNRQVELGKLKNANEQEPAFSELQRKGEEAIAIDLKLDSSKKTQLKLSETASSSNLLAGKTDAKPKPAKKEVVKKRSVLEEIIEEDKKRQKLKESKNVSSETQNTSEPSWLAKDIIVKIVTKELGSKFYKEKAVIREVIDNYAAVVKLLDSGAKLKLDQSHLETVIPNVDRPVLILLGPYKNCTAKLKKLDIEKFSAALELTSGKFKEKIVYDIPYEYFSKLNS